MNKDFDNWGVVKKRLNCIRNLRTFNEREIWWCSVGLNIGYEIYGKNELFNRPVLIIKKFSSSIFLGVPLTSNCEFRKYRYPFSFKEENGNLVLDQIRTFDARRLNTYMGRMSENQFETIKQVIKDLL